MENPFITGHFNGHPVGHTDAQSRIEAARRFDRAQCLAALEVPGLQKTVRNAVERRLRKLEAALAHQEQRR
ncbi:hypothetical protein [Sediminicurvatus halobius]|uniref:Uncharacterized protein n=1 Tax=Sediminicurvatus halobius TaxID=2182432 RepID=A0A2U2MYC8_9GAMM|nr:hypothetical protein [Spiribacter halobius]PWG61729.1 hypothetical protein DEM34_14780 [Spiribacter halobius]UEX76843.1 hypothetical protein LMH63_12845 [Spiribacter halobius]